MPEIRVDIKDTLTPALDAAAIVTLTRMARAVEREGIRLQSRVQRYMRDAGIYDTGELRKSVHQRTVSGFDFTASTVATNTRYAAAVHEGTKAGRWVPVDHLIEWVRRRVRQGRLQLATPKGKRRKRGAKLTSREQEIRGIAFAIRAGIYKRGTKARPFMDTMYRQEEPGIRERLGKAVVAALKKAVSGE